MSGNGIHEAFSAFEDLQRASNAMHGKEGIRCSSERGMGVSQTFPIGEASRTRHTQGIVGRAADRNRIGGFLLAQTKPLRQPRRRCICSLGCLSEALVRYSGAD